MLQIKNICKQYKTGSLIQQALNDVSLNLRDNEFVAILGPSGSGKTTLLNVIGGLDTYDRGDLIINGISTKKYKDRDWDSYRNHTVGFVFQSYNLIPHQTICANVELALTISGISKAQRRERSLRALEQVGLKEQAHKKPNQLSGGQMQRVAIARALVNDPDILLADEPTGALDSETSVQVMELLKEVAKDRLVVMVTHNPELAHDYATRIVDLRDGKICFDSNPFEVDESHIEVAKHQNMGKTSMSWLTSLSLSFNNLKTKKARTILTSFAGSIGIIGIALILSLSNGVNQYIQSIEEETLSEYPLSIQSSGFDMSAMIEPHFEENEEVELDQIKVANMLTNTFSKIGSNDLASLKKYLDAHQKELQQDANSIEYLYNIQPQIFQENTHRQVNPDQSMAGIGMAPENKESNSMYEMSMAAFYRMPNEKNLYENQYDVKAGHWPQNHNECVLVLNNNGKIADFYLYTLGLRDPKEFDQMLQQFARQEKITIPETTEIYHYEDILGINFKVVPAHQFYQYDAEYKIWRDKKEDEEYMHQLLQQSEDLTIVGIVQPKDDSTAKMLMPGIYYPSSLTQHLITTAANSKIVQEQLKHPDLNVLSGKSFDNKQKSDFSLNNIFSIDTQKIQTAFSVDANQINPDFSHLNQVLTEMKMPTLDLKEMLAQLEFNFPGEQLQLFSRELTDEFNDYLSAHPEMSGNQLTDQFLDYLQENEVEKWVRDEIERMLQENGEIKITPEQLQAIVKKLVEGYQHYIQENDLLSITSFLKNFIENDETQVIIERNLAKLIEESGLEQQLNVIMSSYMQQVISSASQVIQQEMTLVMKQMAIQLPQAIRFDEQAFARAIEVKMTQEELTELLISMMSTEKVTYDSNLKKLGYADLNRPEGINLYPKNFESKNKLLNVLDNYNANMEKNKEDDKVISYSDMVGTLMSSVTDIINVISYVLIAFVAISLVVSSIMIGVITYISVLERKKEIGILRAIGASKRNVSQVFNAETFIIGLLSGLMGIACTLLLLIPGNQIIHAVAGQEQINASLPVWGGVVLVVLSTILTLIGGIIPSKKAAKEDPVTALRTE